MAWSDETFTPRFPRVWITPLQRVAARFDRLSRQCANGVNQETEVVAQFPLEPDNLGSAGDFEHVRKQHG